MSLVCSAMFAIIDASRLKKHNVIPTAVKAAKKKLIVVTMLSICFKRSFKLKTLPLTLFFPIALANVLAIVSILSTERPGFSLTTILRIGTSSIDLMIPEARLGTQATKPIRFVPRTVLGHPKSSGIVQHVFGYHVVNFRYGLRLNPLTKLPSFM